MKNKKFKINVVTFYTIVSITAAFWGCNSDIGFTPQFEVNRPNSNNVSVSFSSQSIENDNNLILTETKFVLRQLRLKENGSETMADIRMEPFVVNLNVTAEGRIVTVAVATIPSANYHHLKLQIHKPNQQDNITDPDFFESNKSFSVVVKGMFNGVPFVFKSAINEARGINIDNSPIFITPTILVNLTISLDPYLWFYKNGQIMNPMNQNNWHDIDSNIKDSFNRVFKDLDMNGQPD